MDRCGTCCIACPRMTPTPARTSAAAIRRAIVETSHRAGRGHIGSALSVADLVAGIVEALEIGQRPRGADGGHHFVLSKGHAALAYYAALEQAGVLETGALAKYCSDGSALALHPDRRVPGVPFSTGSLGQGISFAVGSALAARHRGSPRRTVVLASDAELNCGVTWEALMFAAHHRLARFQIVVDWNGSQALGATRDVLDLSPLAPRLSAFGFDVTDIDGHDAAQVREALAPPPDDAGRPRAVIARTRLGRGVSFMEGRLEWHYLTMTPAQYSQALLELDAACDTPSSPR